MTGPPNGMPLIGFKSAEREAGVMARVPGIRQAFVSIPSVSGWALRWTPSGGGSDLRLYRPLRANRLAGRPLAEQICPVPH
jgi:hypothetical protein